MLTSLIYDICKLIHLLKLDATLSVLAQYWIHLVEGLENIRALACFCKHHFATIKSS